MSNQAGLVREVAKSLFISEATLSVQLRILREADLIPTGGRGKGAYTTTPQDAATLVAAAAVSSAVKDTASITNSFLTLPLDFHEVRGPGQGLPRGILGPSLQDPWPGLSQQRVLRKFGFGPVPERSSFLSALTMVVEKLIKNEMFPDVEQSDFEFGAELPSSLKYRKSLTVDFYLPLPCAQITYRAERILTEFLTFGPADARRMGLSLDWYRTILELREMGGSLVQLRSVDALALERIAKAVGEEGLREAMSPRPSKRTRLEKTLSVDEPEA